MTIAKENIKFIFFKYLILMANSLKIFIGRKKKIKKDYFLIWIKNLVDKSFFFFIS